VVLPESPSSVLSSRSLSQVPYVLHGRQLVLNGLNSVASASAATKRTTSVLLSSVAAQPCWTASLLLIVDSSAGTLSDPTELAMVLLVSSWCRLFNRIVRFLTRSVFQVVGTPVVIALDHLQGIWPIPPSLLVPHPSGQPSIITSSTVIMVRDTTRRVTVRS